MDDDWDAVATVPSGAGGVSGVQGGMKPGGRGRGGVPQISNQLNNVKISSDDWGAGIATPAEQPANASMSAWDTPAKPADASALWGAGMATPAEQPANATMSAWDTPAKPASNGWGAAQSKNDDQPRGGGWGSSAGGAAASGGGGWKGAGGGGGGNRACHKVKRTFLFYDKTCVNNFLTLY